MKKNLNSLDKLSLEEFIFLQNKTSLIFRLAE